MISNKFIKNNLTLLQKFLFCYGPFDNRIVEGYNCFSNFLCYSDLGFKHFLLYFFDYKLRKQINWFVFYDSNLIFNEIFFDLFFFNKTFKSIWIWFLIRKCYMNQCFLKGRFLNIIKNGFSIGICGIVCFLPKTLLQKSFFNKKINNSVFYVKKLDFFKKICIVSQKNIIKQSSRILFKLSLKILKK